MSAQLDALTEKVTKIEDAGDGLIVVVNTLAAEIRDLKEDPAALEALATRLEAQAAELAEAVVANTPAE